MGLSFPSLPSLSDVRNSVTNAANQVRAEVRDISSTVVQRGADLGRAGADLGRRAVDAVRSVDVREAASTVRGAIGQATEAGRAGISDGVAWTAGQIGRGADAARAQVTGDGLGSRVVRGAIDYAESNSRFSVGFVGGVAREAVGLVGTAGQLGTTVVEMQVSPEANREYSQRIAGALEGAARSTVDYAAAAIDDPSRIGRDLDSAADAGGDWVEGQVSRYEQAIREGRTETIGMDAGTIAANLVPFGGGPARGIATAAVREGGETLAREGTEALVREGGEAVAREGAEATARESGEALARQSLTPLDGLGDIARRTGASESDLQRVIDLGRDNRPPPANYLSAERISEHRAAFEDGASRFSLQHNVDKYGLGQRDGTTFVMTPSDANEILRQAGGDPRKLEQALGLPAGQLDGSTLVRVDFPAEVMDDLDVRMPSGNEAGANDQWLPGGYLPSGADEAVLNGGRAAPGQFTVNAVE